MARWPDGAIPLLDQSQGVADAGDVFTLFLGGRGGVFYAVTEAFAIAQHAPDGDHFLGVGEDQFYGDHVTEDEVCGNECAEAAFADVRAAGENGSVIVDWPGNHAESYIDAKSLIAARFDSFSRFGRRAVYFVHATHLVSPDQA